MRAVAFTGGRAVPGARFRVRQYIPTLRELGVTLSELPAAFDAYPPLRRSLRPLWAVMNLTTRLRDLARAGRPDVVLLQREFLSSHVTLEPLTPRPRVLDVDDAIWLYGGEGFARRLAGLCDLVVCGNAFLAEQFGRWNPNVEILPTGVDTDRFVPSRDTADSARKPVVIGWSGTSSTLPSLHAIEAPLAEVMRRQPGVVFRVVCDRPPELSALPRDRVEFVPWSPEREVAAIQGMTIGLMPIEDSVAARGKCSLKMLLYMACGLPVVVSPVGTNAEILAMGEVGRAARSHDEWVDAIDELIQDRPRARSLGTTGRSLVVERFSVSALAPRLAALLRSAVRG